MAWPSAALADFDPATGQVHLAGALNVSFESASSLDGRVRLFDSKLESIRAEEMRFGGSAIEGRHALVLGSEVRLVYIGLRDQRLADRRVEITFWQRPDGLNVSPEVVWYTRLTNRPVDINFARAPAFAVLPFQPSGRMTDDGWVEWTSGPVDYSLVGNGMSAVIMRVGLAKGEGAARERVLIDALEVRDLGPAVATGLACTRTHEAADCGAHGACMFGRCVDAALGGGPLIQSRHLREEWFQRRVFEMATFEGSRRARERTAEFEAQVLPLAHETSPRAAWDALREAYSVLDEGHATAPYWGVGSGVSPGICLGLGEADLLDGRIAPMVFEIQEGHPLGSQARPGDLLVEVDGQPVEEWLRTQTGVLFYSGDPAARDVVLAPWILFAVTNSGGTATFLRCPGLDGEGRCASDHVRVDVDMAAWSERVWSKEWDEYMEAFFVCDHRIVRPGDMRRNSEFSVAAAEETDGAVHVAFNGFPIPETSGPWADILSQALSPAPDRIILDERRGMGGYTSGIEWLSRYLLDDDDFWAIDSFPGLESEPDATALSGLRECARAQGEGWPDWALCGFYTEWRFEGDHPAPGAAAGSRLAVLVSDDVSGNDILTRLLAYRPGETRIFGPGPTQGAYGPIVALPSHLGERSGGSFQLQDSVFQPTDGGPAEPFSTGFGVPPDEMIFQRQSDAMLGRNTLLEAAKAWVTR